MRTSKKSDFFMRVKEARTQNRSVYEIDEVNT